MPSLNMAMLMGNVVRKPELHFQDGVAVCEVTLAVTERWKERGQMMEETTFVGVMFEGKAAETLARGLRQGEALYCEGKIRQVEDAERGPRGGVRKKTRVVGRGFQFLGGGVGGGSSPQRHREPQSGEELP